LDHVGPVLAHVDDTSGYFHDSLRLSLPRQRIQGYVRSRSSNPRAGDKKVVDMILKTYKSIFAYFLLTKAKLIFHNWHGFDTQKDLLVKEGCFVCATIIAGTFQARKADVECK